MPNQSNTESFPCSATLTESAPCSADVLVRAVPYSNPITPKAQEDRSALIQGAVQPRYGEVHIRNRGRLPHWEKEEGLYFLTFHQADSLPRSVLARIAECHRILRSVKDNNANLLPEQKALLAAYSQPRIEEYFDRGAGSCAFNDQRIAAAMTAALRFREGKHYRLLAWCIMPNHVHVVVRLFPGQDLARIVKAWKNFSAKAANHMLGSRGRFWQREYFDRLIRNGDELDRAIRYVVENPAKAGLKDWIWVWSANSETQAPAIPEAKPEHHPNEAPSKP